MLSNVAQDPRKCLPNTKIINNNNNTRLTAIFRTTRVSRYQIISTLDFAEVKDDRGDGDNCKSPVKSSPLAHHHRTFL